MNSPEPDSAKTRPTEPMPKSWKPAMALVAVLLAVTAVLAVAAAVVDRMIYG